MHLCVCTHACMPAVLFALDCSGLAWHGTALHGMYGMYACTCVCRYSMLVEKEADFK